MFEEAGFGGEPYWKPIRNPNRRPSQMYRAKAQSGCEARAAAQALRHSGVDTAYSSWVVCGRRGLQKSRHSMSAVYSYNSDQSVCW